MGSSVDKFKEMNEEVESYVWVNSNNKRKEYPMYSGLLKYFPKALKEVSHCSFVGQQQHNPHKPLAWDRSKSGDELDAMLRHLSDHAKGVEFDDDGVRHIVKCCWRLLAITEKILENGNR